MKVGGSEPDVVVHGIMINRVQMSDDAVTIFDKMTKKGFVPSAHVYCSLITGLGSAKRLEEALHFKPEAPTYNALVGAYSWSTRRKDAYKILDEMQEPGIGGSFLGFQKMSTEHDVSIYEIVVRMFCSDDGTDMAISVWDLMKSKRVLLGMHMYSTLITSLCHKDKLADACKYFWEMLNMRIMNTSSSVQEIEAVPDRRPKEEISIKTHRCPINCRPEQALQLVSAKLQNILTMDASSGIHVSENRSAELFIYYIRCIFGWDSSCFALLYFALIICS